MTVHALEKSNVADLRANVSREEWQARVDLAEPPVRRPFGAMDWPALLWKLDRIDPGFGD